MSALAGSIWQPGAPPGVYERRNPAAFAGTVRLDTAVFIGLCERGPLAAPVVIESWDAFRQVFGNPGSGRRLPDCVRLFFDNGGRRCVVLRALHQDAIAARWELPEWLSAGGARAQLYARSPGAWGDAIRGSLAAVSRPAGVEPDLPTPPAAWDGRSLRSCGTAFLDPTRGSVLRFEGPLPLTPLYRTVVSVRAEAEGTALLELDSPLPVGYRLPEAVRRAREVLLDLELETGGWREAFTSLGMDPAHPRFLPWVLACPSPHETMADHAEARARHWPVADPDARFIGDADGPDRDRLPAGSALAAPAAALLSTPLELMADAPLDRKTLLAAKPVRAASESGDTFERGHFALTRDALLRHERRHLFAPGALYCLPDLMHPGGNSELILPGMDPASSTRFGGCTPPAPVKIVVTAEYPRLGLQGGLKPVLEAQQDWLDWLSGRREEGWPAMLLLDAPPDMGAQEFIAFRRGLAADFAALYAPWLRVGAPAMEGGDLRFLPPSPLAAAAAAEVEQIGPHGAPAHREIRGVAALHETGRMPQPGLLQEECINLVRDTEVGPRLLGSRTTSFDPQWTHVNVRRLVDWIKRQLALDARWAAFEPNHGDLRSRLRQSVERRLRLLFEKGAFSGRTPEESFFVRARGDRADAGEVILEVGVAPSVPMEFIVFELMPPAPEGLPMEEALA